MLRFIDNANFLNASLDSLVSNLSKKLIIQKSEYCEKCKESKKCEECYDDAVEWCDKCKTCQTCLITMRDAMKYMKIANVIMSI